MNKKESENRIKNITKTNQNDTKTTQNSVKKAQKSGKNDENLSKNLQKNEVISKTGQKSEKPKQDKKMYYKLLKSNAFVAILLVFALSVLSVCSLLVAGNLQTPKTLTANVANTRIVQAKLAELGYYNQEIDGIFDNDTITAVKNYQHDNNLRVTGSLDQSTTTALGVTDNTQANTDLYLLAKLIHSEARGEIYEGQVAVGAVVLNRVRDAGFPNTIQGVIYQPWAFTALNDGQFALEPTSTSYQAAQDAMNGWDPTYGCTFYYNPVTATSKWILSREIIVRIGNHVFCI